MKRRWLCLALALLLLFSLAACGAGSGKTDAADNSAAVAMDGGMYDEEAASPSQASGGGLAAVRENAKLILRADRTIETQEYGQTIAGIEQLTGRYGGYIESSDNGGGLGERTANYTIRIPQDKFEAFLKEVGDTCHVVRQSQSAEDISEQYGDAETRLATLKTKHARLLELLEKAEKMEDIIAIESALSDTQYEIDSLTGTLRSYDSLVDFATVSLYIREVQTLSSVADGTGFGAQVAQAARGGLHGLGAFGRGLVLTVVGLWPLLLVLGAGIAVFWNIRKRRKAKREQEREQ